jgi:hypothetical protein
MSKALSVENVKKKYIDITHLASAALEEEDDWRAAAKEEVPEEVPGVIESGQTLPPEENCPP